MSARPWEGDQGVAAVRELLRRGGVVPTDEDLDLLGTIRQEDLPTRKVDRHKELVVAAMEGFYDAAADGYALVPVERIKDRFGSTLEQNYPEASDVFLRFATTYWTLKLLTPVGLGEGHPTSILGSIDRVVGALFFPTPGPVTVDPNQRERDQRDILSAMAPRIDVEDFMAGNPILLRDRRTPARGCALALLSIPWDVIARG